MSDDLRNLSALELAAMININIVNEFSERNCPGAKWLESVRDAYLSAREEIAEDDYPSDALAELVSHVATAPNTGQTWRIVTDLQLFNIIDNFDYGVYADEMQRLNPQTYHMDRVWAIDKDKLTDALQWWLNEVAGWLINAMWSDDEINPDNTEE